MAHCCSIRALPAFMSLLLISLTAANGLFDSQLGDITYCKKQCQTALQHTSTATDRVLNACHRGCRLFSICQFVNGNAGFNTTLSECEGACLEAYSRRGEQDGCVAGCRSQPSEAESRRRRLEALAHKAHPSVLDMVSDWCSNIVSSAQSFISSTWTFYLQADDGKVVVFQSQPETEYAAPELQAPRSDVAEKSWPPVNSHTLTPHAGPRERAEKGSRKPVKTKHPSQHADALPSEHDFLGCMSRRSGLPRWILAACLFLSIMVMLWLSCASLVTAPDQHVKTQLSINGDKEFLDDVSKVSPYPLTPLIAVAVNQTDEREDAGPLPVKVDLDQTII
ncbi:transmembrane protein 59-like isoform X2 [Acipenser ruthenus]|uniref:transmembrane protein 59-like isoform X2 n=1 Tax=Acipenser ruthenus TaxID=7906 RepID=UPI002741B1B3|nr:transmembrane protein 59-like isoform X2 [Acipenser ruthenus]